MKSTAWLSVGLLGIGVLVGVFLVKPGDNTEPRAAVQPTAAPSEERPFNGRDVAVYYDEALRAEVRDEGWAPDKEHILAAALAEVGKTSGIELPVVELECRSSMCRCTLAHRSKDDARRFLEYRGSVKSLRGSGFVHMDESRVSVYIAREGMQLPAY